MAEQTPPRMRFWGWGEDARAGALPAHARSFLDEHVGTAAAERPPVALEQVRLEPSNLSKDARAELAAVVGEGNVRVDHAERVLHAAGKGYPDLVRLRAGEPEGAPDAVVHPASHDEIRAVLMACAARSIAVVPFGGGTSVVGGVAPLRGSHEAAIALETGRLGSILSLDQESATVTVGAGMRGPALERELSAKGLTLGHFPQSFEYVSLGGCAATRSAGQASTGYGSIEKMV
ncbi:MAG TPA: FAD-binding oxidoreductase, partial [Solirubrobacteraceae bacterium]|nr:FAD-binding oxidoreductase [Solirubrobacteraceae bacterium]